MEKEKKQWIAPVATEIEINGGPNPTISGEDSVYHVS
ncbi:hypothetical protein SAMN05192550_0557 [Flavobacterium glycines]|uniref:Paeninodin family lasso peptide n=1 Tax=Flavobacterium glycines TaxID=551990 RepID=A0A1G8MN00_9FLAO|nr:hypothetical protein SAMN05192550_0557 [Flavobacterium glycines]